MSHYYAMGTTRELAIKNAQEYRARCLGEQAERTP